MDKTVLIGIIGIGNMGSAHVASILNGKISNAKLVAIADLDASKIEAFKNKYDCKDIKVFASGDELIEQSNVDIVLIATPHYSHPELSINALKHNINVICEKPPGVYTKQVKEMNEASQKSSAIFAMMFNQRTNPLYQKMRNIIIDNQIGEIKRINWIVTDWYRSQSYYDSGSWRATWKGEGGGVLFNQCPHQLDLLSWITGMMPNKVRAFCHFGKWHDIEVEDDVTAYMEYDNGATGVFVTSTADTPGTNRFEIMGTKGKLVCESNKLFVYQLEQDEREFNRTYKGGFGEPKFTINQVEIDYTLNTQHNGIIQNVVNSVLGKEEIFSRGVEGLNCTQLMNSMLLSTWTNSTISLPIDDELYLCELQKRIAESKVKSNANIVLDVIGTH